jgi:ferritin
MNDYQDWYRGITCVITQQFLLQFLEIQRKSVGEYGDLLTRLKIVQDDAAGQLMIDKELGNG